MARLVGAKPDGPLGSTESMRCAKLSVCFGPFQEEDAATKAEGLEGHKAAIDRAKSPQEITQHYQQFGISADLRRDE